MHVLFVTSEVAGVFKIGGLADVSYSLPVAMEKLGVHVTVVLPFYTDIPSVGAVGVGELAVDFGENREIVFVFRKTLPGSGVTLLLLRHPTLDVYGGKPIERTFAFYSKAVASLYAASGRLFSEPVDIVHCHDWHTALIPLLIGENNKLHGASQSLQSKNIATILTIHNLMYQGVDSDDVIESLHAPRNLFHIQKNHGVFVSFLREGFEYADCISTVSPTYSREIVEHSHHDAIGESLIRRKKRIVGILNGIDTMSWNPQTDTSIQKNYSVKNVGSVKQILKKHTQKIFRLPTGSSFMMGFVGRIEPRQKGIDLVMDAIKKCINDIDIQLVILGTGDYETVVSLQNLVKQFPEKISFMNTFSDKAAREIYSGSDALLVPSKFEPCGLTQMIAMRYGTLPIVRKTGGLADSVLDGVTGFMFDEYAGAALEKAVRRSYDMYAHNHDVWTTIQKTAMNQDFSWTESARKYEHMYKTLIQVK